MSVVVPPTPPTLVLNIKIRGKRMIKSPYLKRQIAKKNNEKEKLFRIAGKKLAYIEKLHDELTDIYYGLGYLTSEIKHYEKMDIGNVNIKASKTL